MEVILAKTAGFCFGVKRAVDMAYAEADRSKNDESLQKVYTYGPIIHNEVVIRELEEKGVHCIESLEDLKKLPPSRVIIRSHGIGKKEYDELRAAGHEIVDATCPFVGNIHRIVKERSEAGDLIIIVGDPDHAEVQGIRDWCVSKPIIIQSVEDANKLDGDIGEDGGKMAVTVVSQTTFHLKKFEEIVVKLREKYYNIRVCQTICNATEERQNEAREIASKVDAMIVIGGKNSSNTQKLAEISKQACRNTYYIQTVSDLDLGDLVRGLALDYNNYKDFDFKDFNFKDFNSCKAFVSRKPATGLIPESTSKSICRVGITAGASTPSNIIKEVLDSMSEEKVIGAEEVATEVAEVGFEQMLNEENPVSIRTGQIVEGKVIDVKPDELVVNINYKSDGIVTANEYSNSPIDLTTVVKVDDDITAKVIKVNDGEGQVLLSVKRVRAEKASKILEAAFNDQTPVTGVVKEVRPGNKGIIAMVEESRVFIPASLVADTFESNLDKYVGQEVEFRITEFEPKKGRVIGNRKELLIERKKEAAEALFARIEAGQVVEGTVKNVTTFGAFIDLGGADGLLHISEMSWEHVVDPKKVLKVGDVVKCFIKSIDGEKIALSRKFEDENPWVNAREKYAVGTIVTGRVARMNEYAAFVVLEPGIDAFLHVSNISRSHVEKPSDVLKAGELITAKVIEFNEEKKRINISLKALETDDVFEDEAADEAEAAPAVEEEAEDTGVTLGEVAEIAEDAE